MTRPKSFTLIELLVVISIIMILASMLLPALSKARMRSEDITCRNQMKQTGVAAAMYANDFQDFLPLTDWHNKSNYCIGTSTIDNHKLLSTMSYLAPRKFLICPSMLRLPTFPVDYTVPLKITANGWLATHYAGIAYFPPMTLQGDDKHRRMRISSKPAGGGQYLLLADVYVSRPANTASDRKANHDRNLNVSFYDNSVRSIDRLTRDRFYLKENVYSFPVLEKLP